MARCSYQADLPAQPIETHPSTLRLKTFVHSPKSQNHDAEIVRSKLVIGFQGLSRVVGKMVGAAGGTLRNVFRVPFESAIGPTLL